MVSIAFSSHGKRQKIKENAYIICLAGQFQRQIGTTSYFQRTYAKWREHRWNRSSNAEEKNRAWNGTIQFQEPLSLSFVGWRRAACGISIPHILYFSIFRSVFPALMMCPFFVVFTQIYTRHTHTITCYVQQCRKMFYSSRDSFSVSLVVPFFLTTIGMPMARAHIVSCSSKHYTFSPSLLGHHLGVHRRQKKKLNFHSSICCLIGCRCRARERARASQKARKKSPKRNEPQFISKSAQS